ncbi:3-oxoacyl-ACP synthase, partial [Actinosynnema sp. NPDC023658]
MAVRAGTEALVDAGVDAVRIGCVVVATTTDLTRTPAVAVEVAYRLGAKNAGAFDLSAASAGFCYALAVAADQVRAGRPTYVLVIGADLTSASADGAAAPLLSDG